MTGSISTMISMMIATVPTMNNSNATTTPAERQALRESFYQGANELYNNHFTTCHPFPAREIMAAAIKAYPEPKPALREVEFSGTRTRFNPRAANAPGFEVFVGGSWDRACLCEPDRIEALHDLMRMPYTVTAP